MLRALHRAMVASRHRLDEGIRVAHSQVGVNRVLVVCVSLLSEDASWNELSQAVDRLATLFRRDSYVHLGALDRFVPEHGGRRWKVRAPRDARRGRGMAQGVGCQLLLGPDGHP